MKIRRTESNKTRFFLPVHPSKAQQNERHRAKRFTRTYRGMQKAR
jgi:hypothetical protein